MKLTAKQGTIRTKSRTKNPCAGLAEALLLATAVAGCGTPGAPHPPSLELPELVTGLAATRTGDTVSLAWTMPGLSTDKLPLRGPVTARVCRALQQQKCERIAEFSLTANQPAGFDDHLPSQLASGPPTLLTYTVELVNHAGHSAGVSAAAYTAAGSAPAPLLSLAADVRKDGVLLHWEGASGQDASGSQALLRIHRKLVAGTGSSTQAAHPRAPFAPAPATAGEEQVLLVKEQADARSGSGRALDTQAAFDKTYMYRAERILEAELAGHAVTISGLPAGPITVVARDVFPPATPTGLVAVTVPEEHAIDLSWTADQEPDLAGYIVYRRDAGLGAFQRISAAIVAAASFRDSAAVTGHRYSYAVSAIDQDGNESEKSSEVEEVLPTGSAGEVNR